jgi:hypothetical protein
VLTQKVQRCRGVLRAHQVGRALYGLQDAGDTPEVRALVSALYVKVKDCREEMKAQDVFMALCGLQSLGDSNEARQILAALVPKVETCKEDFKAEQVLHTLGSLQHLAAAPVLRELFAALVPKVKTCRGFLTDEQFGAVMPILEKVGDCEEVRQLTAALTSKVHGFRSFYGPNYGGLALIDMQSWEHSEVMQDIIKALEQEHLAAGLPTPVSMGSPPGLDSKSMMAADETPMAFPPGVPPVNMTFPWMTDDAVTPKEFMGTSQMDPMGMRMEGVSSSSVQELDVASNAHFQHFFPPLPIASPPGLHEPKY